MILKELNQKYRNFQENGVLSVEKHEFIKNNQDRYMFFFPKDFLNLEEFRTFEEVNRPLIRVYKLCKQNNYIFGTGIKISFSIFLITLDGSFLEKFKNFLDNIIFDELKQYRKKDNIGGVEVLDLLYTNSCDDLNYFIIFDKAWDLITIEIYSTIFLDPFATEREYNMFYFKIRNFILNEGIFLEKSDKENKLNFYRQLYVHPETQFFFYIYYYHKIGYHPHSWWQKSYLYFSDFLEEIYGIENSVVQEHSFVVSNNKFLIKWAIYNNQRPLNLSAYKNESLTEICNIYDGLGVSCRIVMNNSFLKGFRSSDIIGDMVLEKTNHEVLLRGPLDTSYDLYENYSNGDMLYNDWYLETLEDYTSLDFMNLAFYNNYGDITAPIYPDFIKARSVSFLSSVRSPHTKFPKPLNLCVYSPVKIIDYDLYDEIQMKIPEYDAKYNKVDKFKYYGIDFESNKIIISEDYNKNKKKLK